MSPVVNPTALLSACTACLLALVTLLTSSLALSNTAGVFPPDVQEGHRSFQYRVGLDPDNGTWGSRLHYQQSLNDNFMARGIIQGSESSAGNTKVDFAQAELFWALSRVTTDSAMACDLTRACVADPCRVRSAQTTVCSMISVTRGRGDWHFSTRDPLAMRRATMLSCRCEVSLVTAHRHGSILISNIIRSWEASITSHHGTVNSIKLVPVLAGEPILTG